jgi:desulfoferrodoxin (superoxide reductase-like protein)
MSNFPKIKAAKFDIIELKDFLVQQEDLDQGWDPKLNLMVVTEEDTNLMNKYRINFHSLTSGNSKSKAKSDFINFSKKFYTDSIN